MVVELWDLYNDKRELLGRTYERGTEFGEGEYYICTEAWIVNPEGKLLITQRHPSKKLGGWWEVTGGGVHSGETTINAAARELQEEIGLFALENELIFLDTYQAKNYFMDVYVIYKDVDIVSLILQEDEVINAKLITVSEFEKMAQDGLIVKTTAKRYELYKSKLFIQ